MTHDVAIVGGGFAGVTAAREASQRGARVLVLEARDRLGGRTWTADWNGLPIEYGGGWVHWHQPHVWTEITRARLEVYSSPSVTRSTWYVGGRRRAGDPGELDAIVTPAWDRFMEGDGDALPLPYAPLTHPAALARFDQLSIAERIAELALDEREAATLVPEMEAVCHCPLDEAGAASALRWHVLSGRSLALTEEAVGQFKLAAGTSGLLQAMAAGAEFELCLEHPVSRIAQTADGVEIHDRAGRVHRAGRAIVAVPLNTLAAIEFEPPLSDVKQEAARLGQASRGLKIFIRARGDEIGHVAMRTDHPFGYVVTDKLCGDGSQILIGFGTDAGRCDPTDVDAVQRALDAVLPGYEVLDATAHNWVDDEYARGTWAIHRPGWYTAFHAEMQRPEGRLRLAGSDIANGWAGFIDGAIESGIEAGSWACGKGASE